MDPLNPSTPPLPEHPGGESAITRPRRAIVGRIGLIFSCMALAMIAVMTLLRPG
jgi:hypothetical protein